MLRSFFDPWYLKKMIKKWPEPKMSKYQKICFFMPVNHAKEFLKSNHARGFFSWLFSETLNFYFQIVWPRRPSLFRQKMFAMLMSTSNLMHPEIWAKWSDSNDFGANWCGEGCGYDVCVQPGTDPEAFLMYLDKFNL